MRGFAAEHAVADLSLGILHEQPSLRALHEHDEADEADGADRMTTRITGAIAPVRPDSKIWQIEVGKRATMPAKMISEMPLPTPRR